MWLEKVGGGESGEGKRRVGVFGAEMDERSLEEPIGMERIY